MRRIPSFRLKAPTGFKQWALLLVVSSLVAELPSSGWARVVERIVAVINHDVITLTELDEVVMSVGSGELNALSDPSAREARLTALRREVLEQMIDQRILSQQYQKLQITVSSDDIDSTIAMVCQQNNITREELEAELVRQGFTQEAYREQLEQSLLQSRFIDLQIRPRVLCSEENLKQLYNQRLGELSTEEMVELEGVFIQVPRGGGPESVAAARKKALAIRDGMVKGGTLEQVTEGFVDGSVRSLSRMGRFTKGELMDPLDTAVFSVEKGGVTEPLEVTEGIYVLRVKERGKQNPSDVLPFEKVHEQLLRQCYDEQVERQLRIYVKSARKDAHVEILL